MKKLIKPNKETSSEEELDRKETHNHFEDASCVLRCGDFEIKTPSNHGDNSSVHLFQMGVFFEIEEYLKKGKVPPWFAGIKVQKKVSKKMSKFDKSYFINSKISNYVNYPKDVVKKFKVVAWEMTNMFNLKGKSVLDYGCAQGIFVKELQNNDVLASGTDRSFYAISEGRKKGIYAISYYSHDILESAWEMVFFLDVLEHMEEEEINDVLSIMKLGGVNNVFVEIPVSKFEGEPFVLDVSNRDLTHVTCHTKKWWKNKFKKHGFRFVSPIDTTYLFDSEGVTVALFK